MLCLFLETDKLRVSVGCFLRFVEQVQLRAGVEVTFYLGLVVSNLAVVCSLCFPSGRRIEQLIYLMQDAMSPEIQNILGFKIKR